MAEISVIVPVYNVEAYLRECVESIIHQSFADLEIILVDDGSKDNSGNICNQYAEKDKRVRVIHKENGGLSDARNCGLKVATSEFISFIDSDDYIDIDFYSVLLQAVREQNSDIAVSAICHFVSAEKLKIRKIDKAKLCYRDEAMKELIISKRISNSVCNKLFRRKLFEDIYFPVGKLYEDEYVTYKLFHKAQKVSIINSTYYYYRYNYNSITHSPFTEKELDRIYASEIKMQFYRKVYPELTGYAACYLVYDCISVLRKMKCYDKKYDKVILKNIRRNLGIFLRGDNSSVAKMFALISAISPTLAVRCSGLIKK